MISLFTISRLRTSSATGPPPWRCLEGRAGGDLPCVRYRPTRTARLALGGNTPDPDEVRVLHGPTLSPLRPIATPASRLRRHDAAHLKLRRQVPSMNGEGSANGVGKLYLRRTERPRNTPAHAGIPRSLADPRERLEMLCDPGSFRSLRSAVQSRNVRGQAGDGVTVGCRPGQRSAARLLRGWTRASWAARLAKPTPTRSLRAMQLARQRRGPDCWLRRVRRRPPSGGPRRARRLRAHLQAQRQALRRVPQISIVAGISAGGRLPTPRR